MRCCGCAACERQVRALGWRCSHDWHQSGGWRLCGHLLLQTRPPHPPRPTHRPDRGRLAYHLLDPEWSLAVHLHELRRRQQFTWRDIFWQVAAQVHTLYCGHCQCFFQAADLRQCRHHPLDPEFRSEEEGGTYPCCGRPAWAPGMPAACSVGCQCRDHVLQAVAATRAPLWRQQQVLAGLGTHALLRPPQATVCLPMLLPLEETPQAAAEQGQHVPEPLPAPEACAAGPAGPSAAAPDSAMGALPSPSMVGSGTRHGSAAAPAAPPCLLVRFVREDGTMAAPPAAEGGGPSSYSPNRATSGMRMRELMGLVRNASRAHTPESATR